MVKSESTLTSPTCKKDDSLSDIQLDTALALCRFYKLNHKFKNTVNNRH